MKIYLVRHQAVGFVDGAIFTAPPSESAIGKIRAALETSHGFGHPKYNDKMHPAFKGADHPSYGKAWEISVEEFESDPADFDYLVAPSERSTPDGGIRTSAPIATGHGVGHVENPE